MKEWIQSWRKSGRQSRQDLYERLRFLEAQQAQWQAETQQARQQTQAWQQACVSLQQEIQWRRGAFGTLEHYVKDIHRLASEYPGKLAIAVFSCVEQIPFNPFDHARDVHNQLLTSVQRTELHLRPGEHWFARFIGYYSSLNSHLLTLYKTKKDEEGRPLAESQRLTLTGVRSDKKSPIFENVLKSGKPFSTFLKKETYGLDMIVKVYPIFDVNHRMIGMVSYTHDITLHLDHQQQISTGLKQIQSSASEIFREVDRIREVSDSLREFSRNIGLLDELIQTLMTGVERLEKELLSRTDSLRLLSLNTQVEAARVGKYGAGFAVIARESQELVDDMVGMIRQLQSVGGKIEELRQGSVERLQAVQQLSQQIQPIVADLQKAGTSYQELIATIASAGESSELFIRSMTE